MKSHSLSVIDPSANIGRNVTIGPFCVIEADTTIGDDCILESRSVIKQGVTLGRRNHLHEGAVLGTAAQHAQPPEVSGTLTIGDDNVFRENVTIHRALHAGAATVIGNGNLMMVNSHVAHDCHVGNRTILANNVMLAGHVTIEDCAFLSGASAVHQFCRVGGFTMIGGQARVLKDVPPYVTVDGRSEFVVGLNLVGLKRNGFLLEDVRQLKAAYRVLYRSSMPWNEVILRLEEEFPQGPAARLHQFIRAGGKRGFAQERRRPRLATISLPEAEATRDRLNRKAG